MNENEKLKSDGLDFWLKYMIMIGDLVKISIKYIEEF
jgi:hypothetical protein